MKKFFIKKQILARDIKEALRKEVDAHVSEVYEDYSYVHPIKNKIGFTKKTT